MKIIHTADWHIGKILHKHSLTEDIMLFFDWLIEYIHEEKVDLLLVSGDVFDLANPSNQDAKLYYQTLYKLSHTGAKVIITGGNHDSISLLDAPSDLLDALNIQVIGGARENNSEEIIPVYDNSGQLECIVLAVPFLRDKDLRQSLHAGEALEKSETMSSAIKKHYDDLVVLAQETYGTTAPIIAMGHLYMKGSITSDSERDIHVGNLQGLEVNIIHPSIAYMALGHIHKPQRIAKKDNIRYSGSPIFLDFSEKDYEKMVIKINVENAKITEIAPVLIPKSREVVKISGTLEEVTSRLSTYKKQTHLKSFVEIEVLENITNPMTMAATENLASDKSSDEYEILKSRTTFADSPNIKDHLSSETKTINELSPLDIFEKKLEENNIAIEERQVLKEAYMALIDELSL